MQRLIGHQLRGIYPSKEEDPVLGDEIISGWWFIGDDANRDEKDIDDAKGMLDNTKRNGFKYIFNGHLQPLAHA